MFFFKLMYLKKKKKLDNRGAALASVLLITTFVMVITSSVLSMAYNTYRMKLINESSKDNFYACEAVLEQVRVGFRNQFSAITDELGEDITSTSLAGAFEEFYADYALDTTYSVSSGNVVGDSDQAKGVYYYDIYKVACLLTSISGTNNAEMIFDVDASGSYASLDYDGTTPVFTSEVGITVSGYDNISVKLQANATGKNNFELTETYVTFHDLTVIYSENGYESQVTTDITVEFPEVGNSSSGSSGSKGGWKTLMDNRVNTYAVWQDRFENDPDYADNNFGKVSWADDDVVYINTTDYPANTVSCIIFDMTRYLVYEGNNGTFSDGNGGSVSYSTYYQYLPVYPWVQVEDGISTGGQYTACQQGYYDKVEIYIGPEGGDLEDPDNWVSFTSVFDVSNNLYVKEYTVGDGSDVEKYVEKYGDYITSLNDSLDTYITIPTIKYRVTLEDDDGNQNSRGWIEVTGGVMGDANSTAYEEEKDVIITPDLTNGVEIYVNIDDAYNDPEYYFYNGGTSTSAIVGTTGTQTNWIFMDLSDCNYSVGDTLVITISNILNYSDYGSGKSYYNEYYYTINQQMYSIFGSTSSSYGSLYPTASTEYGLDGACTVEFDEDTKTEIITITMKWNMYPYLSIQYITSLGDEVTLTTEWKSGSGSSSSSSSGDYDEASIYYQDWRKE